MLKTEIIKDRSFLNFLTKLQDSLERDGLETELSSLSSCLAKSMQSDFVMATRASTSSKKTKFSFLKVQKDMH